LGVGTAEQQGASKFSLVQSNAIKAVGEETLEKKKLDPFACCAVASSRPQVGIEQRCHARLCDGEWRATREL